MSLIKTDHYSQTRQRIKRKETRRLLSLGIARDSLANILEIRHRASAQKRKRDHNSEQDYLHRYQSTYNRNTNIYKTKMQNYKKQEKSTAQHFLKRNHSSTQFKSESVMAFAKRFDSPERATTAKKEDNDFSDVLQFLQEGNGCDEILNQPELQ